MTQIYSTAPLPFVGQKRNFIKVFRQILNEHIPNEGAGFTIIDVFGGSGLLAHNAKRLLPKARVIYNDFDDYSLRLKNISDTNRLRQILFDLVKGIPRQQRLSSELTAQIKSNIKNFNGFIDVQSIAPSLLFSGRQVATLDDLLNESTFYNTVRAKDFKLADDYLADIEIVKLPFDKLIPMFDNQQNVLLILDPPYLCTDQRAYTKEKYFNIVDFLILMSLIKPPFMMFSSTKSELMAYLDYIKQYHKTDWQRLGDFKRITLDTHINTSSKYQDNLIYRFD